MTGQRQRLSVFKKDIKHKPDNYRPVIPPSVIANLLKTFLRDRIYPYLEKDSQQSFVDGDRAGLLEIINYIDKYNVVGIDLSYGLQ